MDKLKCILTLVPLLALVHLSMVRAAETGSVPTPQAPTPEITACVVYSETDRSKQRDCLSQARASCVARAATCELPIGLGLTNNEQLDGNAKSWKKVLVHYRCNQTERVNGPHIQDDHATMIISCAGRQ
jgi:hypothetical protein